MHELNLSCCRMENEDYCQELSDNEIEIGQQDELVGVVAPQPVNIPLEVRVFPADNPESPSLSPPTPSPVLESPPQQLGDAPSFLRFFTSEDLIDLEQWTVDAQSLRGTPDLRLEELEIWANLKTFLRFTWGPQWEYKFIQPAGEVLFCKFRACLAGYNLLTSFNRRQWLRLFPAWTVEEKWEQLESLASSGGTWSSEVSGPSSWLPVVLGQQTFFIVSCPSVVVKILDLHKK